MANIHANGRMSAKITVGTVQVYSDGVDPNLVYTKEEVDEKIENIELTPGPKGDKGDKGEDGYTPIKGVDYFDGEQGPIGPEGPQGIQGEKGEPGENGKDGEQGPKGEKGDKGDTGEPGTTDYNQLENKPDLTGYATKEELNEVKQSVSNGKELLASAITDKGVNTSKDDTFQTMANNVSQITTGDGPVYENPDFYELRTKGGTDYSYLFYYGNGSQLDLSGWDTSNVTNMYSMFSWCTNLSSLDMTGWDTTNVTNMSGMFEYCVSLLSLDLSNFDTSNVTNMTRMFHGCTSLTSLDLSNFDTSNVTNMTSMFYECSSLVTLDLSNWDTSKVTSMFEYSGGFIASCDNLEEVIGILDLSKVNGLSYGFNDKYTVFRNCPKLKKLQLKNIYKDVSMTDNNKWTINLSGTIIEDQYLISIINELPDLINDKGLTAPSKIKLMLPPTNTLTQEQVQPAIDKGWQVTNTTY